MTIMLKVVIILLVLLFVLIIVRAVKRRSLNINFSMFWILISVVLIISTILSEKIEYFSRMLGFEKASNMVFFVTIFLLFYLILMLMVVISKELKKNILLVQEISILKQRVEIIENNKEGVAIKNCKEK